MLAGSSAVEKLRCSWPQWQPPDNENVLASGDIVVPGAACYPNGVAAEPSALPWKSNHMLAKLHHIAFGVVPVANARTLKLPLLFLRVELSTE